MTVTTPKPSHGHFAFLSGILLLALLLGNLSQPAPVLHVLWYVECGAAIGIDVTIEDAQLLLVVRLEGDHLVDRDGVLLATAVHPQLVDGLFVDMLRIANLVIVEGESHELLRGDKLELSANVRDASRVQLQD